MPKKNILVVDDDEDILDFLSVLLQHGDFQFIGAQGGAACLEVLAETEPDLILLDIEMPDMDGFQTLEKIRQDFPGLKAPVAFLTAKKSMEMFERAAKLGSKQFMLKPFEPHRFLEQVKELTRAIKPYRYN